MGFYRDLFVLLLLAIEDFFWFSFVRDACVT